MEVTVNKIIQFEEAEFNNLLVKFAENIIKQQEKGYGISLISNETGERITDKETICGSLMLPWNATLL